MHDNLTDLIAERRSQKFAVDNGTRMHMRLQNIIIDGDNTCGDADLIAHIQSCNGLTKYFAKNSKTEVPVAGTIGGKFISRRIDRMCVDHPARRIMILDYKTDLSPDAHREKYIRQLDEYRALLQHIYPEYDISAAILWTHQWRLEQIKNP